VRQALYHLSQLLPTALSDPFTIISFLLEALILICSYFSGSSKYRVIDLRYFF
jgi:hypothetical protein